MAVYRRVYDSRHLQADCKEPGSVPEPYARQSSMGYLTFTFYVFQIKYTEAVLSALGNCYGLKLPKC